MSSRPRTARRPVPSPRSAATLARKAGRPLSLTFVRHAESARNLAKQGRRFFANDEARAPVAGVADHRTPLTPRGHLQAAQTGAALWRDAGPFDRAWHSGYRRTQETLDGLLAAMPPKARRAVAVGHHLFLRERDTGYTFDMTDDEARRAFPWLQSYWDTYGPVFGRPPGGESLADVAERCYLFLTMVFRECPGQRVLVVTHGGTLWMFRMLLERWSWDEAERHYTHGSIPQCAVTRYVYDPTVQRLSPRDVNRVYYAAADLAGAAAGDRG
jgi:probable phosphoglycerate mutase